MSIKLSIILGVFSGILSSYILFLIRKLWKNNILPWYSDLKYDGIKISGTWELVSDSYDRRNINLMLKQKAASITGFSTHTLKDPNKEDRSEKIRSYILNGYIKDRFLILVGRTNESTRIGALTFLFEIIGDGQTMQGVCSAYSSSLMKIDSRPFTAKRIKE